MRRRSRLVTVSLLLAAVGLLILAGTRPSSSASKNNFDITSTYIEACSCDMFCPCYFNTHSTTHEHAHFCRANLVFRVDKGYYKDVKLDGAKVWLSNDLGSDWSTGKDSWVVLTYDPSVTPAQKAALDDIVAQLYPFKWTSTVMMKNPCPVTYDVFETKCISSLEVPPPPRTAKRT